MLTMKYLTLKTRLLALLLLAATCAAAQPTPAQLASRPELTASIYHSYEYLQAAGLSVDKANYTEVYAAPLAAGTTLEDLYRTFNVDHPADFKGHSLSVSDVVVLHQNGQDTAHYCDSVGFQQVPEFLRENPLRTAELSTEQNENMIDGVLNNAPSLGELEVKARSEEHTSELQSPQ